MLSIFLLIRLVGSASILTSTVPSHRFDRLIHSVVRKTSHGDILHPTLCPSACQHLYHADNFSHQLTACACQCPESRPVYLSTVGFCVDRISKEECRETIRWQTDSPVDRLVPVVRLSPHTIVLPNNPLQFSEAGVIVNSEGKANCTLGRVFYENIHHKWKTPPRKSVLFELTYMNNMPILYFRGTEFDASFLAGAVVQIKMRCDTRNESNQEFCIALRISGISGDPTDILQLNTEFAGAFQHADRGAGIVEEPGWRIEMILLLAFVAFIVITLTSTFVVWNICWKIKKRKLISDFQMQFIQQYRHQQNKMNAQLSIDDIDIEEDVGAPHGLLSNRRRLYFSSEYFDRDLLENPPPMAEQFLYDLRRMVDVAKERIRQRRFIPVLGSITEEPEEEVETEESVHGHDEQMTISQESSPRSEPKSVDSGRESKEDSEDDEDVKQESRVSDIVKNFEKSLTPRPSQLPILRTSSMKLRKNSDENGPKLSRLPQPKSFVTEKKNELECRIRAPSSFGGRSLKERKGYAVYPSDGTFNKSLPRRPKRLVTPPN
ncbi:unnamed protein product [Caenorhabditis bovis]|uniref:Shavenoid isoform B-like N-terminal domain-containing protein n=1 Tax=Caenorhabditis bovis TaxID=2654633 RepID=A0A8S1FDZ8_9PELO|nr:unnamed protein product [Caenorhabditis bovis]